MRAAETYRGARRNCCLRGVTPRVWGPAWYHPKHKADYKRATELSKKPSRDHPLFKLSKEKLAELTAAARTRMGSASPFAAIMQAAGLRMRRGRSRGA